MRRFLYGLCFAHQRIDVDVGLVEFRLRAPLAILAATAAPRIHDRTGIDTFALITGPQAMGQFVQLPGGRRAHQFQRFVVTEAVARRYFLFQPDDLHKKFVLDLQRYYF